MSKRHCKGCQQDLPRSAFGLDCSRPGGLQLKCRPCTNAAKRATHRSGAGVSAHVIRMLTETPDLSIAELRQTFPEPPLARTIYAVLGPMVTRGYAVRTYRADGVAQFRLTQTAPDGVRKRIKPPSKKAERKPEQPKFEPSPKPPAPKPEPSPALLESVARRGAISSESIAADVERFKAQGGVIEVLPIGAVSAGFMSSESWRDGNVSSWNARGETDFSKLRNEDA